MPELSASIVMPFYNRWILTHSRLYELYQHIPKTVEIILVDDCSTEQNISGSVDWWVKSGMFPHLSYVRNGENLGFGMSMNFGVQFARSEVIVLLSNDVIIKGDFIGEILGVLDSHTKDVLVGGDLIYWPAGWNEFVIGEKRLVVPYLGGWLLACKKAVWDKLGGFDRLYGRFDYEDVDLSTRALELGIDLFPLNSHYLKHISGATISSLKVDRAEKTRENRRKYFEKWKERLPNIHNLVEDGTWMARTP